MLNITDAKDLLPALPSNKAITVTTDYGRPDTTTPFVSPVVLRRLAAEGKVSVTKAKGTYLYTVKRA